MNAINWNQVIPAAFNAKVLYSSISRDEPLFVDTDLALIELPGHFILDIGWSGAEDKFTMRLRLGSLVSATVFKSSIDDVIEAVKEVAERTAVSRSMTATNRTNDLNSLAPARNERRTSVGNFRQIVSYAIRSGAKREPIPAI